MHGKPGKPLARIGAGYNGGPESQAALELAASIAIAAQAELHVSGSVDDRIRSLEWSRMGTGAGIAPSIGWQPTGSAGATPEWDELVQTTDNTLRVELEDAARDTGATVVTEIRHGRPANALLELSERVDLLGDRISALGSGRSRDPR